MSDIRAMHNVTTFFNTATYERIWQVLTKATGEGGRRKQAVQPCQHKLASVLSEELRQQAVVLGSTDCFGFGVFDLFLEELPEA